jgi:DNA helicase-2/ATP-dependent DNA helicase PcrA
VRVRRGAAPSLGALFPSAEEVAAADVRAPAEKLLDGLNDAQREVVLHEGGPLACFAGAGSGKTKCLVHRVARLVGACGVEPSRIFCVTFSNAGAREMNERLKKLGVPATVQTWHAFCLRVLKQEQTREGSWTIEGEPGSKLNAKLFLKKAIGYQHENWVGADLSAIRSFIGICKANLWAPEDPETQEEARKRFRHNGSRAVRVYAISESLVEEAGFLLFDNMLTYVARLFRDHEDVRASWAAKFDHVMQDEAQDASVAQVTLARMLAKDHRNYMIVGDPSQAIYGFRGSSPKYIADFPGEWNAKVVTLATNYRSCRRVVAVANEVIRDAPYKLPADMVAARDLDGKVEIVAANTLDDEAEELVAFVKKHAAQGNAISDVAVLYRTNAQSRALEQAFLGAKIPHVIIGNVNFYERKEVKDLLAYLRLAAGADREGDAVKRCINAPFRFLGNRFVEKVQDARDADPAASWQDCVLRASTAERIQDRQRRSALDWVELIAELRRLIDEGVPKDVATLDGSAPEKRTANAHDVLSRVVAKTRYIEWLEKEEGEESIDSSHAANVREMLRVSAEFPTVADFLAFVDKQVAESRKNKQGSKASESVTLMSVHRSKGLEWPVVWIVGCVDGILPHAKGDPDEEQRLFYVAATRARDHLVCSFIREMATRAGVRTVERSEYLEALDVKVTVDVDGAVAVQEFDVLPGDALAGLLPVAEWTGHVLSTKPVTPDHVEDHIQEMKAERAPGPALMLSREQVEPNREHLAKWAGDAKCGECAKPLPACTC